MSLRLSQSFLLLLKKCQWKGPRVGCLHAYARTCASRGPGPPLRAHL